MSEKHEIIMLKDLNPKDIYIGKNRSWMSGTGSPHDPIEVPDEYKSEIDHLRTLCEASEDQGHRGEFAIRHNGNTYRVSLLKSLSDTVFVLRFMSDEIPRLEDLSIHPGYVAQLMQPDISGLIVLAGAFGQGKTTTASALIASRLREFGGVAVTIEDPPELPLEGIHGKGICYQTWVNQGQFGDACRKTARYAPDIIFIGEVRDSETAAEAIKASINGRLVICTTHADNVQMAVERIYSLANGATGTSDDTSSLLSAGLLCVMHQQLVGASGKEKRPKIEFLWVGGDEYHGVKNTIRLRRFDQIGSEITLQLNRLLMDTKHQQNQIATDNAERRRIPRE